MADVSPQSVTGEARPVVVFESESAAALADAYSVRNDLHFVISCCQRLLSLETDESTADGVLIQSLWTSALIAYHRCFNTGSRAGLTVADVATIPGEGDVVGFHNSLRDLRDKHLAHAVNPFETVRVGLFIDDQDGRPTVAGVGVLSSKLMSWQRDGIEALGNLAAALTGRLDTVI